uniref:Uncharacterized protein n=1 Tax=uncultured prokaryote TaxID=198431 RepID=A0A0H5PWU0_9ZZZZ|nr:unnamed protein product [uncultured bacterium]CRY94211.1 hypothetical protein [uncultured prokaryote]
MSDRINATQIKTLMLRSYRRFSNGEISETTAFRENTMLANILKAIEASETEQRLQAIEETLRSTADED